MLRRLVRASSCLVAAVLSCLAVAENKTADSPQVPIKSSAVRPTRQPVRSLIPSEIYGKQIIDTAPRIELPALTADQIRTFRLAHENAQLRKTYIGMNRNISVNTMRDGGWSHPDEHSGVWALAMIAHGAKGIRIHFRNFNVPMGARLFVYAPGHEDTAQVYFGKGPYANRDFWSGVVDGEQVLMEYLDPEGAEKLGAGLFEISEISHLYLDPRGTVSQWEVAGACNLDATCYPAWHNEAESVARILGNDYDGTFGCSGSLVANNSNDNSPLFLTANHCFPTDAIAQTAQLYWDYATTTCKQYTTPDPNYPPTQTTYGANLLNTTVAFDASLLVLTNMPPSVARFSQWTTTPPNLNDNITAIHHPAASWRRLSYGKKVTNSYQQYASDIAVQWSSGVTEPGSSGGPAYNDSHQIVGIVSRGTSSCSSPYGEDLFAPFASGYSYLNGSGNYLVNGADDSYAPNQTRDTAATLPLPLDQTWLIVKATKDDWFKIQVPPATQAQFTIGSSTTNPNFEYYVGSDTQAQQPKSTSFAYVTEATSTDIYLHVMAPAGIPYLRYYVQFQETTYPAPIINSANASALDPYQLWMIAYCTVVGVPAELWWEVSNSPDMSNAIVVDKQAAPAMGSNWYYQGSVDANPNTTYYVRTVVQSSIGTSYSPVITVTTPVAVNTAVWNPASMEFPDVLPGQPAATIHPWLLVTGNVRADHGQLSVTPPFSLDTQNSGCNDSMCWTQVNFSAPNPGKYTGTLTATIRGVSFTEPLSVVVSNNLPAISLDQTTLSYILWVRNSQTKTATLTNTGTGTLRIYSIDWGQGDSSWGFVETNDCPSTLVPGAACHITVTFTASEIGWYGSGLQISANVPSPPILGLFGAALDAIASTNRPSRPTRHASTSNALAKPTFKPRALVPVRDCPPDEDQECASPKR